MVAFKIVLLGDAAVKTALVKNYCNFFNPFESSTGVGFSSKTIELDDSEIKLQLWVISSEERFRFLEPSYVRGAYGAIFMYDIGNHNSLAHINDWLGPIRKEQIPIVLAGVTLGSEEDRIISSEEGRKVAKQFNLDGFIECSAKTGEHVDEMFEELVKMIIQKFEIGTTVRDWVSEIRFYHEKEKEISEIEEIKRSLSKSSINLEMKEEMKRIGSLIEDVRRRLNQNSEKAKRPPSNLSIYLERHEEAERITMLILGIRKRLWLIQQDIRRKDQIREKEEIKRSLSKSSRSLERKEEIKRIELVEKDVKKRLNKLRKILRKKLIASKTYRQKLLEDQIQKRRLSHMRSTFEEEDLDGFTWDSFIKSLPIDYRYQTIDRFNGNYLIPYAHYLERKLKAFHLRVYERIDDKIGISYIDHLETRLSNLKVNLHDELRKEREIKERHLKEAEKLRKKAEEKSRIYKEFITKIEAEYKANDFLTLKLEHNITFIYVKGKRFIQCKRLLLQIPAQESDLFDEIESIDEAAKVYKQYLLRNRIVEGPLARPSRFQNTTITPKQEFWGHCSNIQAWVEYDYDTRLLHSNLSFPLLKALSDAGDPKAKPVFQEEIVKRFESGHPSVVNYLIEQSYLQYLEKDQLKSLLENIKINCGNCGIELPDPTQKICSNCGIPLRFVNMMNSFKDEYENAARAVIKGREIIYTTDNWDISGDVNRLLSSFEKTAHKTPVLSKPTGGNPFIEIAGVEYFKIVKNAEIILAVASPHNFWRGEYDVVAEGRLAVLHGIRRGDHIFEYIKAIKDEDYVLIFRSK